MTWGVCDLREGSQQVFIRERVNKNEFITPKKLPLPLLLHLSLLFLVSLHCTCINALATLIFTEETLYEKQGHL